MSERDEDQVERAVVVQGALTDRCVSQWVYMNRHADYTLAEDDREGEPVAVVDAFRAPDICDIRPVSPYELADWRRKRRRRSA